MKAGYLLPTTLSIRNLTLSEIITSEKYLERRNTGITMWEPRRKQILAGSQIFQLTAMQKSLRLSSHSLLQFEYVVMPLYNPRDFL